MFKKYFFFISFFFFNSNQLIIMEEGNGSGTSSDEKKYYEFSVKQTQQDLKVKCVILRDFERKQRHQVVIF